MAGCGCGDSAPFDGMSASYKKILWVIIVINFTMFIVEIVASQYSNSMALRADALDFLGDSLTYTISLLVIGMSLRTRAKAALFKGILLAVLGVWVFGSTLYRVFVLGVPNEMIMGSIAILAFSANVVSALLLMKYRDGDANVRSVWLCSRNDAIANLAVLAAAVMVFYSQSPWPDLGVAFIMSGLFLHSSWSIIRQAREEMNAEPVCHVST